MSWLQSQTVFTTELVKQRSMNNRNVVYMSYLNSRQGLPAAAATLDVQQYQSSGIGADFAVTMVEGCLAQLAAAASSWLP